MPSNTPIPSSASNRILWADDEIDLLKPHILFLRAKGYEVDTANNGRDAIEMAAQGGYDLVILDENMPGLTGLETLQAIKQALPLLPVIMITKSEEENIMDQAVGNKIADYLIKPVNPNQIFLSLKKNLHASQLVSQQVMGDYRRDFSELGQMIASAGDIDDWYSLYRRLTYWEIQLGDADPAMASMLQAQKDEAEGEFAKFVRRNYQDWVQPLVHATEPRPGAPLMSPEVMKNRVFPLLEKGEKVFFVLIDNFRLDQWQVIRPLLAETFIIDDESLYTTILPTATQYARNAIFSGLMPAKIASMFPDLWVDEDEEEGKNLNEAPLIDTLLRRYRRTQWKFSYTKLNDSAGAEKLLSDFSRLEKNDLNVVVINFIDMLSHARTESKMIRELASTDAAYRSITESWFRHSPVLELLKAMAKPGFRLIMTTDHGTIRVDRPVKVVGDKNTNTNLRYKVGKNLAYNAKQVYEIRRPADFGLPSPNVSSSYIFALGRDFFAYPNNYNYYVQYYDGTFQHGGVSMEEMLVPLVTLSPKP